MKRILVITDEKKSSVNQCEALIAELKKKKKVTVEYQTIKRKLIHELPNILIYIYLLINSYKRENNNFNIILSCGRICAPYNLILKSQNSTSKSIHILDPYFLRRKFDKILIPSHDLEKLPKLSNLVRTTGTMSQIKKLTKLEIKTFKSISTSKKLISCFIGGNGRSSKLLKNDVKSFIKKINMIGDNYKIVYCFSRRTSIITKNIIKEKRNPNHFCYDYIEKNPYWFLIQKSDFFIVTEDSVSMISDCISTGKPVYILKVSILKKKIKDFINNLLSKGIIRYFEGTIKSWNYTKLNEPLRISKIIDSLL